MYVGFEMKNKLKTIFKESKFLRVVYFISAYWPLYFLSFLFPRSDKIWLISSYNGFIDNSKYFYIFNHSRLKEKYGIKLIWLAHHESHARDVISAGFADVVEKKTLRGIFYSMVAKVNISSGGFDDFYPAISGAAYHASLWHGVGIKNMIFKSTSGVELEEIKSKLGRVIYPLIYRKYDLFLSTSPLMTEHFSDCFALPKNNLYIDRYPRCSPLQMSKNELADFIQNYEPFQTRDLIDCLSRYNKIFIYMPTWRDANPDFLVNSSIDWAGINEVLRLNNNLLLLKPHPASNVQGLYDLSNVLLLDSKQDVYPILQYTDCLITDYSSIYFDYLFCGKNIALFIFDYDKYVSRSRDFAYPYDQNMVGHRIHSISGILDFFENYECIDFSVYQSDMDEIRKKFWADDVDGIDFCNEIFNRICG